MHRINALMIYIPVILFMVFGVPNLDFDLRKQWAFVFSSHYLSTRLSGIMFACECKIDHVVGFGYRSQYATCGPSGFTVSTKWLYSRDNKGTTGELVKCSPNSKSRD
eukprot:481240_1